MDICVADRDCSDRARVIAEYRNTPTDQVISDTIILAGGDDVDILRQAAAATLGFSRGIIYLDTARSLMRQILEDAHEITWRMDAYNMIFDAGTRERGPNKKTREMAGEAARMQLGAHYLSLNAEVLWHFYAASLQHAWHFIANCARTVNPLFEFSSKENDYIHLVRAFRNHMEHRDKAAKDITSDDWLSMSSEAQNAFKLGYLRDRQNNICFTPATGPLAGKEQWMPMNQAGFKQFEALIIGVYERLKGNCIQALDQLFIEHPDKMPSLDQVGKTLTARIEEVE